MTLESKNRKHFWINAQMIWQTRWFYYACPRTSSQLGQPSFEQMSPCHMGILLVDINIERLSGGVFSEDAEGIYSWDVFCANLILWSCGSLLYNFNIQYTECKIKLCNNKISYIILNSNYKDHEKVGLWKDIFIQIIFGNYEYSNNW